MSSGARENTRWVKNIIQRIKRYSQWLGHWIGILAGWDFKSVSVSSINHFNVTLVTEQSQPNLRVLRLSEHLPSAFYHGTKYCDQRLSQIVCD